MSAPWWRPATFYQVYPRSFAPGSPRAVGDLAGIRARLDHLSWLGVDAVWISPFYPSPGADLGYDVSDHCDVDPLFGDLAAFDRLLASCHQRGLRLLVDLVPNHTSDQHPWFQAARRSRDDPRHDWYVWRDGTPDAPPNNWLAAFTSEPAWTWDPGVGQWYLHQFLPSQPDLDWANPEVVEAMHGVMRFWLDRGVDGFRVDAVHAVGKDPALPDDPPEVAGIPHSSLNDTPQTHEILREMRRLVDSYPGDRVLLGEVYLLDTAAVATYYGDGDELHLAFNFPPLLTPWDAARWRRCVAATVDHVDARRAWPTWVLSNHDNSRHRTRYGTEERARAATFLLLGLRGSPVLYAGEELGLEDAPVPPERVVDPGGRDGCRAPLPWTPRPDHGWGVEDPWLPWPPDPGRRNVETLAADEASISGLYRRLLAARRASPALQLGGYVALEGPDDVLAWRRTADPAGDSGPGDRVVAVNMGPRDTRVDLAGIVLVASDGEGEGRPFGGTLPADRAVLLDPGG
ncbi:MAG TPA: alpha-amylase family glycosyl hydrolase [Acidimicrobiales bacterium]|nr:alpha-amylase family glycosyl hydrolase [Acidimicrobiales bacterium]